MHSAFSVRRPERSSSVEPVRILFVEQSVFSSYGGSKRVLYNILSRLDRDRFEPYALFHSTGPYVDQIAALGIPVSAPKELHLAFGAGAGWGFDWPGGELLFGRGRTAEGEVHRSSLRLLARDLRSEVQYNLRERARARDLGRFLPADIDLIHFNAPMQERYEWAHIAMQRGVPFLTHEHGVWRRPPSAFRRVAQRAAAVICLTDERAYRVQEFCGGRVHTEVVPNGVDVEMQQPRRSRREVRAEFGVEEATPLFITASHLLEWKGQGLGVDAARLLRDRGVDFRWFFCGSQIDPEFALGLRRQIEAADLGSRVRLLDQREDVPDLFGAADLVVHTSIRPEPFGMAVIEAMSVGTPVVGPAEGAIAGIVRDDVDGRLYKPRDATALADTIQGLLADPTVRRRLGEGGRRRVVESFSLAKQVERLSAIYERVVGEARTTRSHRSSG